MDTQQQYYYRDNDEEKRKTWKISRRRSWGKHNHSGGSDGVGDSMGPTSKGRGRHGPVTSCTPVS